MSNTFEAVGATDPRTLITLPPKDFGLTIFGVTGHYLGVYGAAMSGGLYPPALSTLRYMGPGETGYTMSTRGDTANIAVGVVWNYYDEFGWAAADVYGAGGGYVALSDLDGAFSYTYTGLMPGITYTLDITVAIQVSNYRHVFWNNDGNQWQYFMPNLIHDVLPANYALSYLTHTMRVTKIQGSPATWTLITNPTYPPQPSPPTSPPGCHGNAPTLNWAAVPGATGYILYRDGVQIYSGTALTYTDTALTLLQAYVYTLIATNAIGNSTPSVALNLIPCTPAVSLPAPASAPSWPGICEGTQLTVTWPAVVGAAGYMVAANGILTDVGNVTRVTLPALALGVAYTVTVAAYDGAHVVGRYSLTSVFTPCAVAGVPGVKGCRWGDPAARPVCSWKPAVQPAPAWNPQAVCSTTWTPE